MKTDTLKKSLLDYAIKGKLTAKFRRENSELSAFDELEIYNDKIKQKRKNLEKELKTLEFKLKKASTRHCETSAGSRGKTSEAVQGVAEAGFFSNPQTKQELKSQIQMLKKELTKCKEITPLNLSESPFTIPNSWAWVKLGDICEMKKGPFGSAITKDMFIPNGSNAVKIYEQKNAIQKSETLGEYYISLEHFEKLKQFEVFENDIIVSCAGTIGEIFRIPKNAPKGIINQALMKIKLVNEEWIPYFMIFFDFLIKQKSQENSKGSAIKNIPPLDILKNFTIPLPPLCEQQEIVKKLDLLVTLANDFAMTKENLKRIEKRIEKSLLKLALEGSLSKLYRRSSPTLSAFNEISTYNDNIKQKRKDLEKEFKKCEKEFKLEKDKDKKALCKSQIQMLKKELTKCKEIVPLNLSEAPFTIPNSWAWVKLGDICEDLFAGGDKPQLFSSTQTENCQVPIYTNGVKNNGLYGFTNEAYVKKSAITISGRGTIGFVCVRNEPFYPIIRLLVAIPNEAINLNYLAYVLMPLIPKSSGTSIPQLTIPMIQNLSIPLPPLKEQEYITQILDTLFTLKKGLRVD
ncbi:restriction endonuclease subunit S [Campylobacter upsaliensis]|uniref:restriction endonuclease subunit S n=2 Tax=Campylobacter upsaliensis TaxID=28080 RepID=UPI002149A354|nr:restriction endonuclease subunit S [Campylobacter upsaliensis]MCR2088192.1 restriction endonuclease subunit S [Campylobacter upsaliensis]